MEPDVTVDLLLPPRATSAAEARRLLRDALGDLEPEEARDAAQLAVSEIVTNALVHAGTQMRLRVLVTGASLRVELADGSPHLPRQRSHPMTSATGRGLHMVSEMVDEWGAYATSEGKVVWFEISDPDRPSPTHPGTPPGAGVPAAVDVVEVELLNMPLLMHAAWQEHAAALLRELLLIRLEHDLTALESHASASDALNVLFEQVPAPDLGDDPEAIMATATEPAVSLARLRLSVPEPTLPHFEVLDEMLGDAVGLAERGELLSPPTQPEIQAMRLWICQQVRQQPRGGPALAWSSAMDAAPPSAAAELVWDPTDVSSSRRALVTADDANRIVAVSPTALALLGYDDPLELIGQRLVSLIPERFHQAHIAGFTLHLVNDRRPLLGNRVTVPVVRCDGSETVLDLLVESQLLPYGRRIFTAEFFA